MISHSLVRALITSAALAAVALLAGCNSDQISLANNAKANQPVPPKLIADMTAKELTDARRSMKSMLRMSRTSRLRGASPPHPREWARWSARRPRS